MARPTSTTRNISANFESAVNGTGGVMAALIEGMTVNNYHPSPEVLLRELEERRTKISNWISSLDFPARQGEILQKWQKNTGGWFLNEQYFRDWMDEDEYDFRHLWCPGQPGAGKTVLTSRVIDYVKHLKQSNDAIICIFCSNDAREAQSVENLLGSMVRQLLERTSGPIPNQILQLYEDFKTAKPGLKDILNVLKTLLPAYGRVYIFIDALDECPESDSRVSSSYNPRNTFLSSIEEILKRSPNVLVMITSRPIQTIEARLQWPKIEISAKSGDIAKFLDEQIKTVPRIAGYNEGELIKGKITKNAQGMFLLASLAWEEVSSAFTLGELRQILDRLPSSLEGMYRNSFKRIQRQRETHVKYANTVLAWISCAIRPLHADEMRYGLAIVMGESASLDTDWLPDQGDLASICAGLVTIDASGTMRLSHYSVQEFLEAGKDMDQIFANASRDMALACLKCLTLDDFLTGQHPSEEEMRQRLDQVPFLRYAGTYWHRHEYRPSNESDPSLSVALSNLFNTRNKTAYYNWLRINQPDPAKSWLGECPWLSFNEIESMIFYTEYLGLEELTRAMLDACEDDTKEYQIMVDEGLVGAVKNGNVDRARFFLEHGGGGDELRGPTGQPLIMLYGNIEVLCFLLDRGADIDATSPDGWSAIQCASRNGHMEIVRFLIQRGARVRAQKGDESALHHAAYFGHPAIVDLLLQNGAGADVNDHGENGPLVHWVANHGQLDILKSLVEYGADLEADCDLGLSVMQRLMTTGYGYTVQGKLSGWGLGKEQKEVALYLLEHVSLRQITGDKSRNLSGQTLLHWAAEHGFEEVARVCIEKGVDPRIKDHADGREPMTARELALMAKQWKIASLLEME